MVKLMRALCVTRFCHVGCIGTANSMMYSDHANVKIYNIV